MKKIIVASMLICIAIVAIWYFFKEMPPQNHNKPIQRIILISLDTTRADHLSCYGYPRETTPFIDSLANKGIRFSRAFSQISTTAPSHSTIFTGLLSIPTEFGHPFQSYSATHSDLIRPPIPKLSGHHSDTIRPPQK